MGDTAAPQLRILRMQPDAEAERARILHRAHQHLRIGDRGERMRKADATRLDQFGHLGDGLAFEAHRQRTQRIEPRALDSERTVLEHLDQPGLIQHRISVRRTRERGHPASQRRAHFRFERGLVFEARFAKPCGQIDQTRREQTACAIDDPIGDKPRRRIAARHDAAVGNVNADRRRRARACCSVG